MHSEMHSVVAEPLLPGKEAKEGLEGLEGRQEQKVLDSVDLLSAEGHLPTAAVVLLAETREALGLVDFRAQKVLDSVDLLPTAAAATAATAAAAAAAEEEEGNERTHPETSIHASRRGGFQGYVQ
jgi:hypothetical protein